MSAAERHKRRERREARRRRRTDGRPPEEQERRDRAHMRDVHDGEQVLHRMIDATRDSEGATAYRKREDRNSKKRKKARKKAGHFA